MPISFTCSCGQSYTVADNLAGKRTQCPKCRASLSVPEMPPNLPDEDIEFVEDDAVVEEPFGDFEVIEDGIAPPPTRVAAATDEEVEDFEVLDDDRPPVGAKESVEKKPKYFLLAYDGSKTVVHSPKVFRVYRDGGELLMVHAGPFDWSLIHEGVGLERMANMAVQQGMANGVEAGIAVGVLGTAATAITSAIAARHRAKRAETLDPMTIEQLRAEVESEKYSFRVTADNTTKVHFEAPKTGIWANKRIEPLIAGRLKFTHDPTGKWELLLMTKEQARVAVRAFRKICGRENVEVDL